MKFRDCFIDDKGNVWTEDTLIKEAENLSAQPFDLSKVSLDELIRWQLLNVRDYVVHYKRVRDADCSVPIILRSDGYPMDGWHRIIKAIANGESLTYKKFIHDPSPDFIARTS